MAKSKTKEANPPKSSTKHNKATSITATNDAKLSQEFVVDSDDEAPPVRHSPAPMSKKISSHLKKAKIPSAPASKPPQPTDSDSDSSESGSTSSNDDEASDSHSTSKEESTSSGSQSDASSTKSRSVPVVSLQTLNGVKRKADESSSNEQTSDTPGDEDEDTSAPEKKRNKTNTIGHAYLPPTGYTTISHDLANNESLVDRSSLAGKQIWHLSAPSSVPISALTSFTIDQIHAGQPVLTHDGVEYILAEVPTSAASSSVYLSASDGFRKAPQSVSKHFHLQPRLVLPNLSAKQANPTTGSAAAADVGRASITTVRPQPKGLRMRFRPAGFGIGRPGRIGSGSEDESDGENEPNGRAPAFQFPRVMGGAHGVAESKGDSAVDGSASHKSHDRKKKSHKKDTELVDDAVDAITATPKKKKKRERNAASPHAVGAALSTTAPLHTVIAPEVIMDEAPHVNGETADEKSAQDRKREEKKMRRKVEKRLAKGERA